MSGGEGGMPDARSLGLEPADLDGHTVEQLGDYLDAGRSPRDPAIEDSPGCQLALRWMERLRAVAADMVASDAEAEQAPDEGWVRRVMDGIVLDARAGERIPLAHPSPRADLGVTEGAVRGIVRSAEAEVPGIIVGRCRLEGAIAEPGAQVRVLVDASAGYGLALAPAADRLRAAVAARLAEHTELNVTEIDIVIRDIHLLPEEDGRGRGTGA